MGAPEAQAEGRRGRARRARRAALGGPRCAAAARTARRAAACQPAARAAAARASPRRGARLAPPDPDARALLRGVDEALVSRAAPRLGEEELPLAVGIIYGERDEGGPRWAINQARARGAGGARANPGVPRHAPRSSGAGRP